MVLVLYPGSFGKLNLTLGKQKDMGFDKQWEYDRNAHDVAFRMLAQWDGEGDPDPGWVRAYPPYYRRRPDGDPAKEYTAP